MIKHEAAFQARFGRWLQYAYTGPSATFELKRTLTQSLPLAQIKDHQVLGLSQAKTGLYHKISDESRSQKPFDCLFLRNAPGYVCIAYGTSLRGFYLIPVEFIERFKRNNLVSLKESAAAEFGTYYPLSNSLAKSP